MRTGRRTVTVAALAGAAVGLPCVALAGGVGTTSRSVSSATASVSSCGDLSQVGVSWTVTAGVVSALSLTAVPAACVGGTLAVTLVGTGGAALGSAGPVSVTGTSQTIGSVAGSATATSVVSASVSVVGP
jgi:hypothetical protein